MREDALASAEGEPCNKYDRFGYKVLAPSRATSRRPYKASRKIAESRSHDLCPAQRGRAVPTQAQTLARGSDLLKVAGGQLLRGSDHQHARDLLTT